MIDAVTRHRRSRWAAVSLLTVALLVPLIPVIPAVPAAMADETAVESPESARAMASPEGFVVTTLHDIGDGPGGPIGSAGLGNAGGGWRFDRGSSGELVAAGSVGVDEMVVGSGESQQVVPQWWGPRLSAVFHETVLLTRWGADGTLEWAQRIGSPYVTRPTRVRIDPSDGAIYLTGTTGGDIDFGSGAPITGAPGCTRCWSGFLAKFTSEGDLLWQVTFRPDAGISYPQGLDLAPNGDVVLSFEWMDRVFVDDTQTVLVRSAAGSGSAHEVTLKPTETAVTPEGAKWGGGTRTTAIVRYAPDGGLRWARVLSGSQNGGGGGLAVLDDGRIAVTANLWGTTRLLDGPAVVEPAQRHDNQSFFVAMLTPDADQAEWVSIVGGSGHSYHPLDLAKAADGSLLVAVDTYGADRVEFDGPGGPAHLALDEQWNFQWWTQRSALFNLSVDGVAQWGLPVSGWMGVATIEPLEGVSSRLTDLQGQVFLVGPPLPPVAPELPLPPDWDLEWDPDWDAEWDALGVFLGPDQVGVALQPSACAPGGPQPMVDVPAQAFYAKAVRCLVHRRITTGIAGQPDRYGPDRVVTRAQMATFIWRLAGQPTPTRRNSFSDVPAGTWYTAAATWLAERGITTGVNGDPTRFAPDLPVTRGQMAAFLWRFANSPKVAPGRAGDVSRSAYYARAVDWLSARRITTGVNGDPTRFAPDMTLTRGQMAAFLFRFGVTRGLWHP